MKACATAVSGIRIGSGKGFLLTSTAWAVLAIACASSALAGTYQATDDVSLRTAIGTANGDGAPSSTITLGNDVTLVSTALPAVTKDLTIDTGSFTFLKGYTTATANQGVVAFAGASGGAVTLKGNVTGVNGGGNTGGQYALFVGTGANVINEANATSADGSGTGAGGYGVAMLGGTLTNNGAITGGSSTGGAGGGGAFMQTSAILTNNGTLLAGNGTTGGNGANATFSAVTITNNGTLRAGNGITGAGGIGSTLTRGGTLTNNAGATLSGGDGATSGGTGANAVGLAGTPITVSNDGTITGGKGATVSGGVGVFLGNFSSLANTGTIQGGDGVNGGAGINASGNATQLTIITNSGTIHGGAGNGTGQGIIVHLGVGTITNSGSIIGGDGAAAVLNTGVVGATNVPVALINSGTISAGAGFDTAILMQEPSNLTLELHKGSVITGNVVGNTAAAANTLILGGDDNDSFDASAIGPQYQNFTSFQKTGNSVWTLTGPTAAAAGPWTVSAGTLAVNGSLANSTVTVQTGATLGGSGTVGATTIQTGATVAPGNSIGTLHVNGAFAQDAGSVYQFEADPTSNASDLILVNGAATIASGASLNVIKNPAGSFLAGAQYTVLTASGGVTGSYALTGDTAASPYLTLQEQQDSNNIYLRVVQTGDPAGAATTGNQIATATGTDSLPGNSGVGAAVLNTPDPVTTRAAFDALSGEALASAKGVLISSSVLVRDTTFDRLRDVQCTDGGQEKHRAGCVAADDRPSLWVQGFGDWGHTFGNANAAGISQTTGGFLTGVDVPVADWRLGIFGGYSRTDFNVTTRASAGASDTYHLGAYGGTALGSFNLRVGGSYSWSGIDTERQVAFDTFTNDLRASYNAGTAQVFGEIGRAFQLDRVSLEPFANVAYVGIHTKGFSETGGDAALTSRPDTTQDVFATFGVRPSTEITIGSISAVLRGMAGWRHTFGDITPSSLVSFAGSSAFTVTGAPIAKEAGVVEAGVSANVSDHAAIGLTYGGQFSNRETDHSIRGTVTVAF